MFPIWLRFRGGKGVATGLGAMAILNPVVAFLGLSIWGVTFKFTKISSLSAILAFSLMPVIAFFLGYGFLRILCVVIAFYYCKTSSEYKKFNTGNRDWDFTKKVKQTYRI